MGDGLLKPGVFDNQSAVVRWLSDNSGIDMAPEEALTKPIDFEEILDFLREHQGYQFTKSYQRHRKVLELFQKLALSSLAPPKALFSFVSEANGISFQQPDHGLFPIMALLIVKLVPNLT